jgi:hypothetical protein
MHVAGLARWHVMKTVTSSATILYKGRGLQHVLLVSSNGSATTLAAALPIYVRTANCVFSCALPNSRRLRLTKTAAWHEWLEQQAV